MRLSCFFILMCSILFVDGFNFYKINTSNNLMRRDDVKPKHEKNNNTRVTTTEIDVIYTTVIISATPTPFVYNVSDTSPAHQQEPPTTSMSSPNNQSSNLKKQTIQDQQAISRMTLTLSLVGGLGVIAVVATLVIFTRLRARTRKQREMEEGGSTYELSGDVDPPNSSDNSSNTSNNNNSNNNETAEVASLSSQHTTTTSSSVEPSAPPALLMIGPNDSRYSLVQKNSRRHIISMSSQTTAIASPSAPTAKELDAMVDENTRRNSLHHHHLPSTSANTHNCSRCTPSTPELPPPAYTPSAPPHYALPVEPIIIESPPNNLPSRRHSLGG